MKNTLESVQDLIACFKWDFSIDKDGNPKICPPKPGRDVPIETWSPVLIALKKFMDGDASTLDEAFGGQSASQRRFINREAERNRIKWLVESFSSDYKELPKNDKHLGVPHRIRDCGSSQPVRHDRIRRQINIQRRPIKDTTILYKMSYRY
jgi:hypothetical protein